MLVGLLIISTMERKYEKLNYFFEIISLLAFYFITQVETGDSLALQMLYVLIISINLFRVSQMDGTRVSLMVAKDAYIVSVIGFGDGHLSISILLAWLIAVLGVIYHKKNNVTTMVYISLLMLLMQGVGEVKSLLSFMVIWQIAKHINYNKNILINDNYKKIISGLILVAPFIVINNFSFLYSVIIITAIQFCINQEREDSEGYNVLVIGILLLMLITLNTYSFQVHLLYQLSLIVICVLIQFVPKAKLNVLRFDRTRAYFNIIRQRNKTSPSYIKRRQNNSKFNSFNISSIDIELIRFNTILRHCSLILIVVIFYNLVKAIN
jgi:hypothetical protein